MGRRKSSSAVSPAGSKKSALHGTAKAGVGRVGKVKIGASKAVAAATPEARPDRWSKSMRREIKRQGLVATLEAEAGDRRRKRAASKRRRRPVIGDLQPLVDSLDKISHDQQQREQEAAEANSTSSAPARPKSTAKAKKRKEDFLRGVTLFQSVLQHRDFRADPLHAISTHVQNKIEQNHL